MTSQEDGTDNDVILSDIVQNNETQTKIGPQLVNPVFRCFGVSVYLYTQMINYKWKSPVRTELTAFMTSRSDTDKYVSRHVFLVHGGVNDDRGL